MDDIKRVGLRMPMELYLKLEKYSKENGISVSNMINFIVAQWVNQQTALQDKIVNEVLKVVKDELKENVKELTLKQNI